MTELDGVGNEGGDSSTILTAVWLATMSGNVTCMVTFKPHTVHGELSADKREHLPDSVFAFPRQRKEPLIDASHVRNALARFDQVEDVTDKDRDLAFTNIKAAAKHYDVDVSETSWRQLGKPE